ncbi:hypothetical protein [Actinomadura sp. BRA 177]|uniref:hypothetical protein n=1 Tax=Actinomadura sp. BRA 177 TaxID=2745202 RepID=UPI00159536FC|nr:hypothetical protein [Actinomadura sp. BRA 177]NVI91879.1 hypothetical protein [Actinomadura sp. BRA 177]
MTEAQPLRPHDPDRLGRDARPFVPEHGDRPTRAGGQVGEPDSSAASPHRHRF